MMKMMRKKYFSRLLPAGLFVFAIALAFFISSLSGGTHSVEVGVAEHSPLGLSGGVVVPASCPSYAHNGGTCAGNFCPSGTNYDVDTGECLAIFCESGQILSGGVCTPPDVCPNISGLQTSVPSGYAVDGSGNCVSATPGDVCPNIAGAQATVPSGYTIDGSGNCVLIPVTDVCANVPGTQSSVPAGYDQSGSNCYPSSPSNVGGSCSSVTGYQANLGWTASPISGATYNVRMDNLTNGWTGTCPAGNAGDLCTNGTAGTSAYVQGSAGVSYDAWVHVCDANGICTPSPTHTAFSCPSAPVSQPPVCSSFTASPGSISSGSTATLSWVTSGATSGTITSSSGTYSFSVASGSLSNGSTGIMPNATANYTLALTNSSGTTNCAPVTVTVTSPPSNTPTMSCSATSVVAGGTITATVTGGTSGDWVGEYPSGASDYSYLVGYNPTTPRPSTVTFTPPTTPGTYQLRLWPSGSTATTNSCTFTVTAAPATTGSISVTQSGGSGVQASIGAGWSPVPTSFTNVTTGSQTVSFTNISGYTATVGVCTNSTGTCAPLSYGAAACAGTQCSVGVSVSSGQVTHVDVQYTAVPSCTPASPSTETRTTTPCPTGQTGTITEQRTSSCAAGASTPTWSAWTTTSNTCTAIQSCPAGYGGTYPNCTCPSGYSGAYPNCTPPPSAGSIAVTSTGASGAQVAYNTNDTASWGYIPRTYTNMTPTSAGWIYFTNFSNYSPKIGVCTNTTGNCTPTYTVPSCSGTQCYTTIPVVAGQTTKVDIQYTPATVSCPASSVNAGSNFSVTVNGGNSTGDQIYLYSSAGSMLASTNPGASRPTTVTLGAPSTAGTYTVKYYLYGASSVADSCTVNVVSNPSCTIDPTSPQTQTIACPTGQTGTITQQRTSSCAAGASTPTWSAWTTTGSNCTTQQSCPTGSTGTYPNCTCASGYTGTYPNCTQTGNMSLSCSATSVVAGGSFTATVTGGSSSSDWLGLYAASGGSTYGGVWANAYVTLPRPATMTISAPATSGTYQLQLWQNASSLVATCPITVTDPVGSISVTRSGATAIPAYAALDNNSAQWYTIPTTFSNTLAASHWIYFTNISGYTATVGSCTNATGNCTPSSYSAASCSGTQCWAQVAVTTGQVTKLDIQYTAVSSCTPDPTSPQTQTIACPTGQTGTITQQRTSSCAAGASTPTWSAWTTTNNTCTAVSSCTPDPTSPQTQTIACPTGQTGTITQQRTSSCAAGASTPTWSAWTDVSNTCASTGPGSIMMLRVDSNSNTLTSPITYTSIDTATLNNATNPYTYTSITAGSHTAYFSYLSGYTPMVGTCQYAIVGGTECRVTSFTTTPTCTTSRCSVPVTVSGGQITKVAVQYTANAVTPTCTITASPTSMQAGGNTTLTWTSSNAISANITPSQTGSGSQAIAVNGSASFMSALTSGTQTYTMTMTSSTGATGTCSATVSITAVSANPTISCSASSVAPNGTISGTVTGGSSIYDWVSVYSPSSSVYSYGATGASPSYINVPLPRPQTVSFTAPSTPGNYELRVQPNNGYTTTSSCSFTVTGSSSSGSIAVTRSGSSATTAYTALDDNTTTWYTIPKTFSGASTGTHWIYFTNISGYTAQVASCTDSGGTCTPSGYTPASCSGTQCWASVTVSANMVTKLDVQYGGSSSGGEIQIKRVDDNSNDFGVTTGTSIDTTALSNTANPATFSGLTEGNHYAVFSDTNGYSKSYGTCIYDTGSSACTVSSFTLAPVCSGTYCYAVVPVVAGKTLKVGVKYTAAGPLSCSFGASPTGINVGDSSLLSWSCVNATTASIDNGVGTVPTSGSVSVRPTVNTNYTLTASNNSETRTYGALVSVLNPVLTITSSSVRVRSGDSVSITWNATNAINCSVSGPSGTLGTGASGTVSSGSITIKSIFTLSCTPIGGGSPVSASVTVTLLPVGTEI